MSEKWYLEKGVGDHSKRRICIVDGNKVYVCAKRFNIKVSHPEFWTDAVLCDQRVLVISDASDKKNVSIHYVEIDFACSLSMRARAKDGDWERWYKFSRKILPYMENKELFPDFEEIDMTDFFCYWVCVHDERWDKRKKV